MDITSIQALVPATTVALAIQGVNSALELYESSWVWSIGAAVAVAYSSAVASIIAPLVPKLVTDALAIETIVAGIAGSVAFYGSNYTNPSHFTIFKGILGTGRLLGVGFITGAAALFASRMITNAVQGVAQKPRK